LSLARRLFRQWSGRDERKDVSDGLLKEVRGLRDNGLNAAIKKSGLSLLTETVSVLAMVFVLAFCALLMSRGYMDASGLVLFTSAVLLCYKPVKECARVMPQFRSAVSAINVLEEFERLELAGKSAGKNFAATPDAASDAVSILGGKFAYEGSETPVFTDLALNWSREKPVLVRGKNGVGKSTLLRLLSGLECWNSADANTPSDVFFVAQDLELPPKWMLSRLLEKGRGAEAAQTLETFMQASGAASLLQKSGLSGGERARVALLWALASDCRTVLLDEPFASVALVDREPLLKAYLKTAESLGKWTIIVSHDVLSPEVECIFNVAKL
jgi:ABC-type nitrate/sulfonate/bicarbonate transport system ATPase subunit